MLRSQIDSYPGRDAQVEPTFYPGGSQLTYSEGERKLPIGLAGRVQVDVLPLPALVVRALALRGGRERRDTNLGVRGARRMSRSKEVALGAHGRPTDRPQV